MKNDCLISIIIPVYKTEAYLDACIRSIVNQTYPHLQIILVDDGSPDGCGAICDAWAEKDSRIQVIHQPNQGVSAARNAGLDAARGEYLLFIDGDDVLTQDAVKTALAGFESDEIDVSFFGVTKVFENGDPPQDLPMETGVYTGSEVLQGILSDYSSFGAGFPVNKVWRVQAFGGMNSVPRFDEHLYFFEDMEWVVRMLLPVNKAVLLPHHCYQYNIHSDSITHTPGIQENREIGYHQSVWRILDALQQNAFVYCWFSSRYYPEVVNGIIHAWNKRWPRLRALLLKKLPDIQPEIMQSDSIRLKIKFRCLVLQILSMMRLL